MCARLPLTQQEQRRPQLAEEGVAQADHLEPGPARLGVLLAQPRRELLEVRARRGERLAGPQREIDELVDAFNAYAAVD